MELALFAAKEVGLQVTQVLLKHNVQVSLLVYDPKDDMSDEIIKTGLAKQIVSFTQFKAAPDKFSFDLGVLAWWPYIIHDDVLSRAKVGFLNFHPSLLPYNRGKHPNFWSLKEETPYGVTIHWVDNSIDGGDIAFQKPINKTWEDTGFTLYQKSLTAIVELFETNLQRILKGDIPRIKQETGASVRFAKEIVPASKVDLNQTYKVRELLNLLRARTFQPYPGCYFEEDGEQYEIRVEIRKKDE